MSSWLVRCRDSHISQFPTTLLGTSEIMTPRPIWWPNTIKMMKKNGLHFNLNLQIFLVWMLNKTAECQKIEIHFTPEKNSNSLKLESSSLTAIFARRTWQLPIFEQSCKSYKLIVCLHDSKPVSVHLTANAWFIGKNYLVKWHVFWALAHSCWVCNIQFDFKKLTGSI